MKVQQEEGGGGAGGEEGLLSQLNQLDRVNLQR